MTLQEEKAALRKTLLEKRAALSDAAYFGEAMCRVLVSLPVYRSAGQLFAFVSMGSEPDTSPLLAQAFADGKEVCVPVCPAGNGDMCFYRIYPETKLRPGRFSVPEPDPTQCDRVRPRASALCLTPGIAFDRAGHRLGYGKGYYDRFFAGYDIESVGICRQALVLPALPAEEHDRCVQRIVTEDGCLLCGQE